MRAGRWRLRTSFMIHSCRGWSLITLIMAKHAHSILNAIMVIHTVTKQQHSAIWAINTCTVYE